MLLGCGQASTGSSVANHTVRVEIHLPIVCIAAVRAHREHRTGEREGQDFDVGGGVCEYVGDSRQIGFQCGNRRMDINGVVELRLQIDTAVRVMAEILDDISEDFAVTNDVADVIESIDRGDEKADFLDRARHASGDDEVADFKGLKDNEEDAGGEISEQSAPGNADSHAGGGTTRREAGGLHTEEAKN